MKKVALYIRVSTQEQAQEGYSIGEQKERLIAYCKAHDWVVVDIYVDGGYSGANLNRPGMQSLISDIKAFDIVLVYKLDRLSRSQRDTLYLIEEIFLPNRVDFVSMMESFDTASPLGKAMVGLLAVFAQLEREQIKERTTMGRLARAKSGLYHGAGHNPIGYNYQNGKLIVNAYEAEQVKKIFKMYLDGFSYNAIANIMAESGYYTRYSAYSSWTTVRRILSNPIYTGQLHYGGVIVENAHEALISKEQFKEVQSLMKQKTEIYGKNSFQSKYLLSGLIFCGNCGARYGYNPSVTKAKNKSYFYMYCECYSRSKHIKSMIKDPDCKNKHWRAAELESIIKSRVKELLQSPELAFEISKQNHKKPTEVKNDNNLLIERRIKEIDRQINKFMELYKVDGIPPEILGDSINKLYNEKTALQASLKPAEETISATSFDLVEELLKNAAQIWDFADESQKRRIIQDLIKRIVLTGDKVDIEWNF